MSIHQHHRISPFWRHCTPPRGDLRCRFRSACSVVRRSAHNSQLRQRSCQQAAQTAATIVAELCHFGCDATFPVLRKRRDQRRPAALPRPAPARPASETSPCDRGTTGAFEDHMSALGGLIRRGQPRDRTRTRWQSAASSSRTARSIIGSHERARGLSRHRTACETRRPHLRPWACPFGGPTG